MDGIGGVCFSMVQHGIQKEKERREGKRREEKRREERKMEEDSLYTLHT